MYNKFKKFVFNNFKKGSYDLVSEVIGKEEIYLRDNKMVVLISDEEVGKRIFDVAVSLKRWGETISSNHMTFKLTDFVADKFETVQALFINVEFSFEYEWAKLSELERLRELVSFAHGMQEKGYILDDSIFDNEDCHNLSDFLSFFKSSGMEENSGNGCLIKYVHYVLSHGGDMEEYYQPIIKKNEIRKLDRFPYHMPVIQMCYNYCLNKTVPENIDTVLKAEGLEAYNAEYYCNKLVVSNPELSGVLPVTESTDTYTVYDKRIKIHKEISSEFEEFLLDKSRFLRNTSNMVEESFTNWVINFEGNIIGYEYKIQTGENKSTVLNLSFDSQRDILAFVSAMSKYIYEIQRKSYSDFETDKHEFNIETDLVCYLCHSAKSFKILTIESLFKLVSDDSHDIKEEITKIFFKLLLAYLEKTYGKISDKQAFYEKPEVRYLSPILAREFCNFALGKRLNLPIASVHLEGFLDFNMAANNKLVFDKNFIYNPEKSVPFLFHHEIENKYGVKMVHGEVVKLSDGRLLVTLERRENLYALKSKFESVDKEIEDKFDDFNEHVKFVEVSEIIYSLDLSSHDLYYVVGYVTTPFLGEPLTMDNLLNFNNKEILKIAGMLMSNFSKYYIDWSQVLLNITHDDTSGEDKFLFYINKLDRNFRILKSAFNSKADFIENFFDTLKSNGYNENAFVYLNLDSWNVGSHLIYLASKMDAFCDEHKIYYDSSEKMCPICLKTREIIEDGFENRFTKLFEDKYAIHYKFSWTHNLKVYKEDCVNMEKVYANVDRAIDRRIKKHYSILEQDCFLPCKKALDSNRKFIGYLYDSVDFQDSDFKDLSDTENLENLPRIMSSVRLILQVKELMNNGLNFIQNPFGNVFLSKKHQKQVQLVNADFLGEGGKKKNTIKWTCEYIHKIISSDSYITIDSIDWKTDDLNYILNELREYAKTLSMYCPIHKLYYSADYLFCPKCVDRVQMKKLSIEYIDSSEISNWKNFSQGGESIIYEYKNNSLAKIFREDQINYSFKNKILSAILSKTDILDKINNENHKFRYIIPKTILVDKKSRKILGYVMDEKVIGKPISVLCDKVEVSKLDVNRKDVLEILITVGEGIQTLHDKANIFIGDLNGRNILFDNDKNVYFLDFDGMGVDDISPVFWTDGYIDPVSKNSMNITKKDDWYSLAIQAFYYLTFTHPFNGVYSLGDHDLEITEKMERRLSLLGHHGITIPTIAVPWDWMSNELEKAFLNIFEGNRRQSIVPELKAQYRRLYGEGNFLKDPEEEVIQIGSKFVAKKNNPFNEDVVRIINRQSAICNDGDEYYATVILYDTKYTAHFPNCMEIIDIQLLEGYTIAFAIYLDKIIGFDLRADNQIFYENFQYDSDNVVINRNTLYLSKDNIIYQIEFDSSKETQRDRIKFLVDQKTVGFLVKFNSKFMLVKRTQDGKDKIYCNSEVLCEIDSGSNSKYNILYDDTTKTWLVISSSGKFITIKSSNGHHAEGRIPADISDMDVKNVAFNKGIIYIPSQDNLHIINVINQMTSKKMECDKIMTPDSHLCSFNSQGFSVVTDYVLYDVSMK